MQRGSAVVGRVLEMLGILIPRVSGGQEDSECAVENDEEGDREGEDGEKAGLETGEHPDGWR